MPHPGSEHRRLVAIMFTDVVGYSALAQRNEVLALELLQEQQQLLRAKFSEFGGHEIKTTGDGFLTDFPSALAAAQCALDIQKTIADRNPSQAPERQFQVRIGVHVCDVVYRDGDVYGDGVNVGARIEPLAAPGGICLSETAHAQVRNKLDVPLAKLTAPELKNIEVPMEVYQMVLPWETSSKGAKTFQPAPRRPGSLRWLIWTVVALVAFNLAVFSKFLLFPLGGSGSAHPRTKNQWLGDIENFLAHYDREVRHKDQLEAAMDQLRDGAHAYPEEARFQGRLAWANWLLYEENNHEDTLVDAISCATNALRLNTGNSDGYLVQGLVALDRGDGAAARGYLLEAKRLTLSTDPVVLISLAAAFKSAGEPAEDLVRAAQEHADGQWAVFVRIGKYFIRYARESRGLQRAQTNFQRAVDLDPNGPLARRFLGQVLLRQHLTTARAQLELSLRERRTPQTLLAVGNALKATNFVFEAIKADPGNYLYHVAAGLLLRSNLQAGAESAIQFSQALEQTSDILGQRVERPLVRAYEAVCLAGLAQAADAERSSERAQKYREAARADVQAPRAKAPRDYLVLETLLIACQMLGDKQPMDEIQQLLETEPW